MRSSIHNLTTANLFLMCHNQTNNNKINRLHERCLRLVYNDQKSSFKDLLEKDGSVSIHHRNLGTLSVELFKVLKCLSLVIFAETFPVRQQSQNSQAWIRKFVIYRFKIVGQYIIPYERDRFY